MMMMMMMLYIYIYTLSISSWELESELLSITDFLGSCDQVPDLVAAEGAPSHGLGPGVVMGISVIMGIISSIIYKYQGCDMIMDDNIIC